MMPLLKKTLPLASLIFVVMPRLGAQPLANDRYAVEPVADGGVRVVTKDAGAWVFRGDFIVLKSATDPEPSMRPGNIPGVSYNVVTWKAAEARPGNGDAAAKAKRAGGQAGDGFDDRILKGDTQARTADVFAAAPATRVSATKASLEGRAVRFELPDTSDFRLSATVSLPAGDAEPVLSFTLEPKIAGYFSVGYVGAPACAPDEAAEFWQPFLWQQKRFPPASFITPAFECPVPATLVRTKNACSCPAPASAARCFKRARKIHTCRSSAAASSGVRSARNTQRVCCSIDRSTNAVSRSAERSCASVSIAAPPAKLTFPCNAAMPGCKRTNVFAPMRCNVAACLRPISTTGAKLPFNVVSTGGMSCHTPRRSQRASIPATTPHAGIPAT